MKSFVNLRHEQEKMLREFTLRDEIMARLDKLDNDLKAHRQQSSPAH